MHDFVPQRVLGNCGKSAPVAFLKNVEAECVAELRSCPTGPPLQTLQTDLSIPVMNGIGGDVCPHNISFHFLLYVL